MKTDPAIQEVRHAGHVISEQHGHDPQALVAHYRKLERGCRARMLRETKRKYTVSA